MSVDLCSIFALQKKFPLVSHIQSTTAMLFQAYTVPVHFSSDWLNAYYDSQRSQQADDKAGASGAVDERSHQNHQSSSTADYRFV